MQCGGHYAALDGGITLLQLRAPEWHKRAWFDLARDLLPLVRAHRVPFVINDHVGVALAAGADGVHVGQRDLPADVARSLLGPDALIGLSASNLAETANADRYQGVVDYLGVGPVWATPTKTDASSPCGIVAMRGRALSGGRHRHIQADNAADVLRAKPDSIAVVSAICKAAQPREAAASLAATIA